MNHTTQQRLQTAMRNHGISADKQAAIIKDMTPKGKATSAPSKIDIEWDSLLQPLRAERRAMTTNMHNRGPGLKGVYAEYLDLLKMAEERINVSRTLHHTTLTAATAAASEVNEARKLARKRPLGTNTHRWQTWVPPHIREAFAARVTAAYDAAGYKRGNRFVPFIPLALRKEVKTREARLRETLARTRRAHEDIEGSNTGYTPYRALYLAAARQAERELDRLAKGYEQGTLDPFDNPLPVNWLALLDPPMRGRLRLAQQNPAAVDPQGLGRFLAPAPENVALDAQEADRAHAEKHPLEDDSSTGQTQG